MFVTNCTLTIPSWAMRGANSGNRIRILAFNHSCIDRYLAAGFVIANTAKFSFHCSNSISNNAPNAVAVIPDAMIGAVSDSFQYTAISLLAIRTIVYLSGV